ncbi:ABC transporter permease [Alkalimonas mucilaginosa]|uniref:ABC transporter permease n=1 Tax=Alkalimonas mucilaginosa TaxID=3057676 RepID=A0ABU7JI66_9GAMM|nr:FtsX-like permease family protein [Alkalimonas sp. MEB004]MEE2025394.1 ABC transporter permease [Alkalimonas sp. MEB004]
MRNALSMLGNYLTTGVRAVLRHKTHLALNLGGLAIGLAAALLILLFVQHEQGFDRMHPDAGNTFRLEQTFIPLEQRFPVTSPAMKALLQDFDARIEVTRLAGVGEEVLIQLEGSPLQIAMTHAFQADANLTDFFQLEVLSGDLQAALSQPNRLALAEHEAIRLFGHSEVLGKQLQLDGSNHQITAVYRLPAQSHLRLNSLRRLSDEINAHPLPRNTVYSYVKLPNGLDLDTFLAHFTELVNAQAYQGQAMMALELQPLTAIHLHSNLSFEMKVNGSASTIGIGLLLAALLLLVASINFINMSTARAGQRAKEVGVRKTLGASRWQLFAQFMLESLLIAAAAGLLALVLVELLLPWFSALVNRPLALNYLGAFGGLAFTTVLTTGLLAGVYPALFISAFDAKKVLSGDFQRGSTAIWLRKGLLVLQGAIAIGLLVATAVLQQQLQLLQQQDTGYQRDARLLVHSIANEHLFWAEQQSLLSSLQRIEGVQSTSLLDMQLTDTISQAMSIQLPGQTADTSLPPIPQLGTGFNIVQTAGFTLLAGRDFSSDYQSDWYQQHDDQATAAGIITETLARRAGFNNPADAIGQQWLLQNHLALTVTVVGVIADVQVGAATRQPEPLLLICGRSPMHIGHILLQLDPLQAMQSRLQIEQLLTERLQRQDIRLSWLDDDYTALYQNQQRQGTVIAIFAALAIALTCVGLFGLAAFSAEQRSREVAMRKVLGAGSFNLVNLLANEYLKLMAISAMLAIPATYLALDAWLAGFSVRVTQSPWLYLLAAAITFAICWCTVATLAWQVASRKPAMVLRQY